MKVTNTGNNTVAAEANVPLPQPKSEVKVLKIMSTSVVLVVILTASILSAQNVLPNDTLKFGAASARGGQQLVIPINIRTSVPYQGWQIPVRFGNGNSPLVLDSISQVGSCMQSVPKKWWFIADFMNNAQWDGVQTCGVAGVVDMDPNVTMPPGSYLVMRLFITVRPGASAQTIRLDTTTASWYGGGPKNSYAVSSAGTSYKTNVAPGSITILPGTEVAAANQCERDRSAFEIRPSLVRPGHKVWLRIAKATEPVLVAVHDVTGATIMTARPVRGTDGVFTASLPTAGLAAGSYFVVVGQRDRRLSAKFVVR